MSESAPSPSLPSNGLNTDEFAARLYEELRRLAHRMFRREPSGATLQPTAVVHEAYLRLANDASAKANSTHFMAIAARVMRRVLIDAARQRGAARRGGGLERVTLATAAEPDSAMEVDVLVFEEALEKLAAVSDRYVQIVELRFFGGLNVDEVGDVLGVSDRMVRMEWAKARSWLMTYLADARP